MADTAASTLPPLSSTAEGTYAFVYRATTSSTLLALSQSASGQVHDIAAVGQTLPPISASATGVVHDIGTIESELPSIGTSAMDVPSFMFAGGDHWRLVTGEVLSYSEDPSKTGTVAASAATSATIFSRDTRFASGTGLGPTGLVALGGQEYDPDPRARLLASADAAVSVTPSVTAPGIINASGVGRSTPDGRAAAAVPTFTSPTAIAAGSAPTYPSRGNRQSSELGGLPLERAVVRANAVAALAVTPVPYELNASVVAVATATVNAAPVSSSATTATTTSVATVAARTFTPQRTATGLGALPATPAGLIQFPGLFDLGARELGTTPLTLVRVSAVTTTSASVTGAVATSGHVLASAQATVTPRAIESASVAAHATSAVIVAPVEYGSLSIQIAATAVIKGVHIQLGQTTAPAQSTVAIDAYEIKFHVTSVVAVATAQITPKVTAHATLQPSAHLVINVIGLRLMAGDGMQVPGATRVALLETNPTPVVYIPGPSIEPLPIVADDPYAPSNTRVAVLTGSSP